MELAKLETGTLIVEKSEGNLNSFLGAVTSSFSSFALQKNIALTTAFPPARYVAFFDKDKLETILINLINNAIKFTPVNRSIHVSARLSHGVPSREINHLTISISDTGIGIPQDQLTKIFERFHQVSEAHREVGTGIGLSLVKELTALMGGTITVTSEIGKGSQFEIVLPIELIRDLDMEQVEPAKEVTEAKVKEKFTLAGEVPGDERDSRPLVLIVEDNSDLRTFIMDSVGKEFQFLQTENGQEGLEKAISDFPELIISDVMMPEMDGITMTGKIKQDPRTSHIPIILLTAKTSEDAKLSGLGTGADDYLTKPFNKQELLLKVRNAIAIRRKITEKVRKELLSEAPKLDVLSTDEVFLLRVKETIQLRLNDEQLSVEWLAEEIAINPSHLSRRITSLTGVSVNDLIRSFRLKKAAQLLAENWGSVPEVAHEVGFSNPTYFSKLFYGEFGIQPYDYYTPPTKNRS